MARGGRAKLGYDGATEERSHERSCFLIARRDAEGADVLVLALPDGQAALPVFGLEEEAGMFLWLETAAGGWRVALGGWRVAQISEADLAALLRDACAGVRWIVRPFAAKGMGNGPATVDREDFLRALSGERSRRGREAGHESAPRASTGKEGDVW
jgi:hypothetical protein